MKRAGEEGYALVAAVGSIALFAAVALMLVSATRMGMEQLRAEQGQLHAVAAADAGIAIAVSNLLADATTDRWLPDGRVRTLRYRDAALRIRVVDEQGKVPIGVVREAEATRMLEQAGLDGDRLRIARDSLLDWLDADDQARPFGAEAEYYRAAGLAPPGVVLATVEELGVVRGFDADLVARLKPFVTTYTILTGFDDRYADPRALAVMARGGAANPATIDRARELAGQRTALAIVSTTQWLNRALSIEVEAALPDGAAARRRAVIELTRSPRQPYIVRAYE